MTSRVNSLCRISTVTYSSVCKGPFTIPSHEGGWSKMWKYFSLFVALPVVFFGTITTIIQKHEEEEHTQPPFVPYEHLRLRTKRFPWGDGKRSFFHNPKVNPLPDGYEDVYEDE